jgi:FkbH-like protein
MASPDASLLLLRLVDRFGDYGIIGFCLAINEGSQARIDTFLMSCRALGRGVETAFLALCVETTARKGARTITGNYVPTKKNAQVANFYQCHGFTAIAETENETQFSLQWEPGRIAVPDHFMLVAAALDGTHRNSVQHRFNIGEAF